MQKHVSQDFVSVGRILTFTLFFNYKKIQTTFYDLNIVRDLHAGNSFNCHNNPFR